MELKNRKVASFRAHLDPAIGPKPRNSFDVRELKNWDFEMTPIGIYVKARFQAPGGGTQEQEHIVPFANIQSIKLAPKEEDKAA
jgi:hypothetical protein